MKTGRLAVPILVVGLIPCGLPPTPNPPQSEAPVIGPSVPAALPSLEVEVTPRVADDITLLTWDGPTGAGHDARVAGVLSVSDSGCVTISGLVLVAPPGSTIDSDGVLHLTTMGDARLGDFIEGGGGYLSRSDDVGALPDGHEKCGGDEYAVLSTIRERSSG